METKPLVVERTYTSPASKVWEAITNANKMRQWYFDLDNFKPEKGFQFQFYGESEGVKYLHLCEVTEVVPGKKITYSWRYSDHEGNSHVTWELFPEGEKTRLLLTHTGLETFPRHKDFTRESFTGGWNYFLGTALMEFLEK